MSVACGAKAAGRRPRPTRRIIQLRAAQGITDRYDPPATSTLPRAAASPCDSSRAVPRLPVAVHVPVAGSYSSALLKEPLLLNPPATSTLPEGSSVAV